MKEIIINSKKHGIKYINVDIADFDWLNQWKWQIIKHKKRTVFYVTTQINGKTVYMHRLILAIKKRNITTDHIDGNGLNNQRNNLRRATYSQNNINRAGLKNTSSKYKGVHFEAFTKKWRAEIQINGKQKKLGRFINEIDAALAYNNAAAKMHGKFAYLNKVA